MTIVIARLPLGYVKQRTGVVVRGLLTQGDAVRANIAANTLRATPLWFPEPCTLATIGLEVADPGGAGALARVGLFDNLNAQPAIRLADGGAVSCETAGIKQVTIDTAITAGIKWLVINTNDAAMDIYGPAVGGAPMLGSSVDLGFGWTVAAAYGALPATWPAGSVAAYLVPTPHYQITSWS